MWPRATLLAVDAKGSGRPGAGGAGEAGRPVPATAVWRQGRWYIDIASPRGGSWRYDVMGVADRPSAGWFAGTPWAPCPGGQWEEQPGGRDEHGEVLPPSWSLPVFWDSPEPEPLAPHMTDGG